MQYIELKISLPDDLHELMIAELFDLDFEGFEQEEDLLIASIPMKRFDDTKREEIERLLIHWGGKGSIQSETLIESQNWNEQWEQSIQPQTIGKFYVHPTWSSMEDASGDKIELLIDPKMAFGTGYHATTRLILEWLPEIIQKGDELLDAGTGTGILSIASLKLGAASAFGFDIDEWSETNARENILLNEVDHFEVQLGSLEVIPPEKKYDVILANINRNALMELMPGLTARLKEEGLLLLSGLLEEDEQTMLNLPALKALDHKDTRQLQEWIAMLFQA